MAQHNASLEKTLQSVFKHKKVGTEVAVAILAVEAMVASGIDTTAMSEETDTKVLGRLRSACAHKAIGTRMANAIATLEAIMSEEVIVVVSTPGQIEGAPHKQALRKVVIKEIGHRAIGATVVDMTERVEAVVDALLVAYGTGGLKEDLDVEAALTLIKAALA